MGQFLNLSKRKGTIDRKREVRLHSPDVKSILKLKSFPLFLLALLFFSIPFEHKYDKIFRFFSKTLVPIGTDLPKWFDQKIYFYPSDITLLLLLIFLPIPLSQLFSSKSAPALWTIFFTAIISIVASPLFHYPLLYIRLLQLLSPIVLFLYLAHATPPESRPKIAETLITSLACAALLEAAIGIAQYFNQAPLGLRIIGEPTSFSTLWFSDGHRWIFDNFTHRVASCSVIRATGTLSHCNVYGGYLAVSILAIYSLTLKGRFRVFWGVALIPLFFAMCLAFSRSALFAWGLGTALWFFFSIRRHPWPELRFTCLMILASLTITTCLLSEQFRQKGGIVNYTSGVQKADETRIYFQNIALTMIADKPLTGVGFAQSSLRTPEYLPEGSECHFHSATHNIYLFLAIEQGLIALGAFAFFLLTLGFSAIKAPYTPQTASLLAIFAAFLFIGLCDFYPILFQQGRLLFFGTCGLLASLTYQREAKCQVA
jgi:O-antigen ligase